MSRTRYPLGNFPFTYIPMAHGGFEGGFTLDEMMQMYWRVLTWKMTLRVSGCRADNYYDPSFIEVTEMSSEIVIGPERPDESELGASGGLLGTFVSASATGDGRSSREALSFGYGGTFFSPFSLFRSYNLYNPQTDRYMPELLADVLPVFGADHGSLGSSGTINEFHFANLYNYINPAFGGGFQTDPMDVPVTLMGQQVQMLQGHGFGIVGGIVNDNPCSVEAASIEVEPNTYRPYADSNGVAIYDSETGEVLTNPATGSLWTRDEIIAASDPRL